MLRDLVSRLRPARELVWLEIHWPAELSPETAAAVLRQLGADHLIQPIALEVDVRDELARYRIGVPAPAVTRLVRVVTALVPDSALTPAQRELELPDAWRVAPTNRQRPVRTDRQEDITRALLAALTAGGRGEQIAVQWLLGRTQAPRPVSASEPSPRADSWWRALVLGQSRLDADQRRALETKRSDHTFACVGRVAIRAKSPGRTRALAIGVQAALRTAEAPGVGIKLVKESPASFDQVAIPWLWPQTMNVLELVGLLGWPLGDQPLPGVPRDASRWLRPDPRIKSNRALGEATAPGEGGRLGLSVTDALQHLHVIGPTGTGKSTLLARLIVEDMAAGRGVVVVEPKGDLIQDVLARIPAGRAEDVVVLDPTDAALPIGLNPLLSRGRQPELVADQVLAVFHSLWKHNWGPRLQDILHSSLLTLASRGDASLCILPALLTNPAVRRRLRAGLDDPVALEPFWAWFEAISDAERQQAIAPVVNKLRPFLLRKSVRAIVGQLEPRFRVDEVFTRRKIVLVSLAKGLIGPEAAALLGSLFVAELWQAVLGRGAISPGRRHPVVVYADEFQDYVHLPTDMADALAQARGLGVGLTLAHQHLSQLSGNLRSSVLANARSRICFQLAADDAQTMARFSGGVLKPEDFQRLARFEAYAQLVVGGEVTQYASLRTQPLPVPTSDPGVIRELSRRCYGRPVDEVEAEILKLLEGEPEENAPVGRRRRTQS